MTLQTVAILKDCHDCDHTTSRQIARINPPLIPIAFSEDKINRSRLIDLHREIRSWPFRRETARSVIRILLVSDITRLLIPAIPDTPASRIDHIRQIRRLYSNPREVPPRTTEIVDARFCFDAGVDASDTAVIDDIPRWISLRGSTRGSHATRGNGHDVDVVEPSPSLLAEDEIDCAEDTGASEELRACV